MIRVVIQSRLSSTRLPGKAMLTLAGMPAVVLTARRAGNTGMDVVVATSDQSDDDVLAEAVQAAGVRVFRGSLHDPLGRFVAATADLADDDLVVRLTGDNAVPDGSFLTELVDTMEAAGEDYIRVTMADIYGVGAEVIRVRLLREAARDATDAFDREHVTPWVRRHTADLDFVPTLAAGDPARVRCTIDTLQDYVVAATALGRVDDAVRAPWRDLLRAWAGAGGALPTPLAGSRDNAIAQGPWVLGAVQLGITYGAANSVGQPDAVGAARILAVAAASGVTHVDTARAYGESEARIGASLAHGLSERIGVVTKIRPLDDLAPDATTGAARDAVAASVQESLRLLRSSTVAALLLHRWADWGKGGGAVADALEQVRADGMTTVIGTSLSTPAELIEALGDPRLGYVQLPFNLADRRWTAPEVQEALAARPDVICTARSVFLQGLLAAPDAARWPVNLPDDVAAIRAGLDRCVQELGRASVADLAVAYVRGHEFVTSVVLGAETTDQVRSQAELMARPALTRAQIARVDEVLPAGSATLIDPSSWKVE
ncbi:cytidylyltransferase [Calidifontibacter sp. DB0510]|uniref:Cytidylyltransferase n=1 Tax=Metallococcus carri TaxID=1656884 RepID=A0A967AY74_9MICO|nr:aldo/keto reductase [Metallococcus carri]NHN54609.1 cytidylyltransferase [Metallococcus carri]NOP36552.1 cytidylyltransferase [Calidifontibacter sp. DB2511S]